MASILATSALKGSRVGNFAGEILGKVDDLVVDVTTGRLMYVIVSMGSSVLFPGSYLPYAPLNTSSCWMWRSKCCRMLPVSKGRIGRT